MRNFKHFMTVLTTVVLSVLFVVLLPQNAQAAEGQYLWPVPNSRTINQYYSSSHDGLDIGGSEGTPIVASKSGTVIKVLDGDEPNWVGYGKGVVISHGDGYYTHYAHMSSVSVYQGQSVSQGQQIGGMGSTGNATGTHLHFAIATSQYGAGGRINCNESSIGYIYSVQPSESDFDVNFYVEGLDKGNIDGIGTIQVYVDGKLQSYNGSNSYTDFYKKTPAGKSYEVKVNITNSNYTYAGVDTGISGYSGLKGTTSSSGTKVRVVICSKAGGSKVIPDGDYMIMAADTSNGCYYLDIEGTPPHPNATNVSIYKTSSQMPPASDIWTITYSDGFYTIKQKGYDAVLDVSGGSTNTSANVVCYESNNTAAQRWEIKPYGNGYRIKPKCSRYSLDILGGKMENATNVQQYPDNNTLAQQWLFVPYKSGQKLSIEGEEATDIIKSTTITDVSSKGYTITCALSENFALSKVAFPIWTVPNGRDDLIDGWETKSLGKISGNKVTFRVNTSDHGNQTDCEYETYIVAFDYLGNRVGGVIEPNVFVPSEPDPTKAPTKAPTKTPDISLKLDVTSTKVICGKTTKLNATLTGSNANIAWKSSDPNIATVDANGVVTGKMAGPVTVSASAAGKTVKCKVQVLYKDVTDSSKFWYEPTNYLTNKGVVKGYDKQTKFKPANECTRAQMVTFIWRLEGSPEPKDQKCKFKDVKKSDYFYKACIWGNEQGVVEGYKDGTFGPQIVCARRHAVTFLWRLAGKPDPKSAKSKFKDVKKKDYFYLATLWASEKKILEGYTDGTFRPDGDCLRRQMVTFLYKCDKFINGKG